MNKTSWADRVEFEQEGLPPPSEKIDGDLKIITDYKDVVGFEFAFEILAKIFLDYILDRGLEV